MKDVILFYRDDCGYCDRAHRAMAELREENPAYRDIPIRMVEETQEPDFIEQFDYYATPCFFVDGKKVFEAHIRMSYEEIKAEVKRSLDAALA